jgi:hypothetical protein
MAKAKAPTFWAQDITRFSERERAEGNVRQGPGPNGELGWVTDPPTALSPDCEPVGGKCACGRGGDSYSAGGTEPGGLDWI